MDAGCGAAITGGGCCAGITGACCGGAMAGCSSGRLRYVVVSEGGVAGVGERLRRLSWSNAGVDQGRLVAALTAKQFDQLEEVPRDEWPAR